MLISHSRWRISKIMKNIVIVVQRLSDGGAERVASILINYLYEHGYNVLVILAYYDTREYYIHDEIKTIAIKTSKKSAFARLAERNLKIYEATKAFNADVVVSFITNEVLVTECKGIPVIHTLRNDPAHRDNSLIKSIMRNFAYNNAAQVIFQTEGAKEFFGESIKNKGQVIFNPLMTDELPIWNECTDSKTFITACRLNKQKNIPMMIRAMKKLHEFYPEYRLDIYGSGEEKNSIEKLIKEFHGEDYIALKGHSTDIHSIMANSFAFVMSSDFEGLSNSMLEALTIGIPCICTDCPPGGARTFIENRKNGLLCQVGNHEELYENMKFLIENEKCRKSFGRKNQNLREKLSSENICEQWEKAIIRAMEKKI